MKNVLRAGQCEECVEGRAVLNNVLMTNSAKQQGHQYAMSNVTTTSGYFRDRVHCIFPVARGWS